MVDYMIVCKKCVYSFNSLSEYENHKSVCSDNTFYLLEQERKKVEILTKLLEKHNIPIPNISSKDENEKEKKVVEKPKKKTSIKKNSVSESDDDFDKKLQIMNNQKIQRIFNKTKEEILNNKSKLTNANLFQILRHDSVSEYKKYIGTLDVKKLDTMEQRFLIGKDFVPKSVKNVSNYFLGMELFMTEKMETAEFNQDFLSEQLATPLLGFYNIWNIIDKFFSKNSNIIYRHGKNCNFFYLSKIEEKKVWSPDHNLENISFRLVKDIRSYLIYYFRQLYYKFVGDNVYRDNNSKIPEEMKSEFLQLLENLREVSCQKNFMKKFTDIITKNTEDKSTKNDKFLPSGKNTNKPITIDGKELEELYKQSFCELFDNITEVSSISFCIF